MNVNRESNGFKISLRLDAAFGRNGNPIDNNDTTIVYFHSLARDHVIDTTLHVYGVAAVPDRDDEEMGKLVIITEAGIMNALQVCTTFRCNLITSRGESVTKIW